MGRVMPRYEIQRRASEGLEAVRSARRACRLLKADEGMPRVVACGPILAAIVDGLRDAGDALSAIKEGTDVAEGRGDDPDELAEALREARSWDE